ncbi:sigma-54-dependent Fis family transcriptional regulator [Paenibacillus sp. JCM 10914]|uniref:sigma-54-dependent Fis family transcriptional regulator n=1 Tax=Paenibacillus sp. JCM 10914 TaxID=1236974 RepID=UPI0003CCB47A|nr:sigma-54-dependent transcriptional regulator [Paenibacillus sp. JCM 10914]GAE05904.1 sigma-L-dependent transcriptional regulator [Paenibacillus sp. JCM 10914]
MRTRVHMIAPYEAMIPVIQECIPHFPELDIQYAVGDLMKGAELAAHAEKDGAEVIISRGGTAQRIKDAVTIPVIDVHLSGYDMIRSLTLASQFNEKTAIVGFSNITSGAQSIIDLMDLPLKVYTIHSSEDVARLLLELKADGYRQIVGDVVTVNTAKAYGLNGLLIHSGKESIVRALEDAQLIYRYLSKNNVVSLILNDLVMKEHPNLVIFNDQNEIIFEQLTDFDHSPLTDHHIFLTNTNLDFHKSIIQNVFMVDDFQLAVTAYETTLNHTTYKVYTLEKEQPYELTQPGIKVITDALTEPIVAESSAMRSTLENIEALYKHLEPIHLLGEKDTGKSFIVQYISQLYSEGGLLLQVDAAQVPPGQLEKIPLSNVRNVELLHIEQGIHDPRFTAFIEACQHRRIGIFMLSEQALDRPGAEMAKLNTIIMPSLSDRLDDLPSLIQHFLSRYHQKYGTTAVKIKDDALQLLRQAASRMTIGQLKQIIKQAALNEADYVISAETLSRLLDGNSASSPIQLEGTLKEIEKEIIQHVLHEENNNQSRAAERLGINRATLWRKLKE